MTIFFPSLGRQAKVKRQITERRYYRTSSHPRRAKDSVIVTMSCGHDKHFKGSQEPKGDFCYCSECSHAH